MLSASRFAFVEVLTMTASMTPQRIIDNLQCIFFVSMPTMLHEYALGILAGLLLFLFVSRSHENETHLAATFELMVALQRL